MKVNADTIAVAAHFFLKLQLLSVHRIVWAIPVYNQDILTLLLRLRAHCSFSLLRTNLIV